jgi:hypothetical protein
LNLLPEAQQKSKMSQFKEQKFTKTGKRIIIIDEEEVKAKPKNWTGNYRVGEEVLVFTEKITRKGKIRKITKTTIQVELYAFIKESVKKHIFIYNYHRWQPEIEKIVTIKKKSDFCNEDDMSSRYGNTYRCHYQNIFYTGHYSTTT